MPEHAVISGFMSQTKDRFHEYNVPKTLEQKFKMVSQINGVDAAEVVFPYECNDPAKLRKVMDQYSIGLAAINVNVKTEPEFRNGGLTSISKAVRQKAVQFIKDAKDFAKAVGADKVTCCPLGDGYEYSFQTDYAKSWGWLKETLREAGAYCPGIPLFIEYKPSETRAKCFIDSAAKTLYLLHEIGNENIGVTIDFGHSIYGNENPAEAVSLVSQSKFPLYIHINDNNALWDWDFMVGTKHFLEYAEFLYYLQEYKYDGYLTSDTSPTRLDIIGTFEANVRITNKIWDKLQKIRKKPGQGLNPSGDYLTTWKFIEKEILGLG